MAFGDVGVALGDQLAISRIMSSGIVGRMMNSVARGSTRRRQAAERLHVLVELALGPCR